MRIAILSQYYPPEWGGAQNRLSDLARRFLERGHSVQVLTALPHYPGNKLFPAYSTGSVVQEVLDGVPVYRLSLHMPSSRTSLRRFIHYCSFALHASLRGSGLLAEADYLITESPPLFLGPVGVLLARRLGAKLVLNVSELWPAAALQTGAIRPGFATRTAVQLEEWCYRHASLITTQSEGIAEDIAGRFPEKTVAVYQQGADIEELGRLPSRSSARRTLGWFEHSFIIGYLGLHGPAQALDQVLLAAQHFRDAPRIEVRLFGDGPEKQWLEARAKKLDAINVQFQPAEPRHKIPLILAALDMGLVPLSSGKIFEGIRPSKMIEIMAAGRPVLLAGRGESARLVEEAEAGVVVPPEEPEELGAQIRELAFDPERRARMGENARRYAEIHFDGASIVGELEQLLQGHLNP